MNPGLRFLGLVMVFVLGILATAWLSNMFKESDVKNSIEYVQNYRGNASASVTLSEYINTKYNIASTSPQPVWKAATQSSFYGVMTVSCIVITASPAIEYRWKAGVVNAAIMPDNPQTIELMDGYDKTYSKK